MEYRVISADSHINEPPDTFVDRVPAKLRDIAPKVVEAPDGGEGWVFDGRPLTSFGLTSAAVAKGKVRGPEDYIPSGLRFEDVGKGSWDPKAHVEDMERDGVDASVLYFGMAVSCYNTENGELRRACLRAYNDWLAEFCSADPERLIGVAMLPSEEETIEPAIEELHRTLAMGYKSVQVPIFPHKRYHDPFYDPLWAAVEEAGVPIAVHRGLNRTGIFGAVRGGPWMSNQVQRDFTYAMPIGDLIFGRVFDRFPKLKFVSGEGRTGWLSFFTQRADESFRRHRFWIGQELDRLPSDYVKANVFSTFIEDRLGILTRDLIGTENQMWSSDYPHSDTTWPNSQQIIEEQFEGVPAGVKRAMLAGNATRLYGLN